MLNYQRVSIYHCLWPKVIGQSGLWQHNASTNHTILRHTLPPDCPQAYWQACPQTCRPWISCVYIYIYYIYMDIYTYTYTYIYTYTYTYIYMYIKSKPPFLSFRFTASLSVKHKKRNILHPSGMIERDPPLVQSLHCTQGPQGSFAKNGIPP